MGQTNSGQRNHHSTGTRQANASMTGSLQQPSSKQKGAGWNSNSKNQGSRQGTGRDSNSTSTNSKDLRTNKRQESGGKKKRGNRGDNSGQPSTTNLENPF